MPAIILLAILFLAFLAFIAFAPREAKQIVLAWTWVLMSVGVVVGLVMAGMR